MEEKKPINAERSKINHPTIKDPAILITITFLAAIGAIIGVQLITSLGISANTSIIGVVFAMILARIPLQQLAKFNSIHSRNLVYLFFISIIFAHISYE